MVHSRLFILTLVLCVSVFGLAQSGIAGPLVKLAYAQFDAQLAGEPDILPEYKTVSHLEGGHGCYIVQFDRPIDANMRAGLEAFGAEILAYIPDFAFVVSIDPTAAAELSSQDSTLPVYWIGLYQPVYKLSRQLLGFVEEGATSSRIDRPTLLVQFFSKESSLDSVKGLQRLLLDTGAGVDVLDVSLDASSPRLVFSVSATDLGQLLPTIASERDVEWIGLCSTPKLLNDKARWVIQSNSQDFCPVWDHGIRGENQILGVGDTGVDVDSCFFYDESRGLPGSTVDNWQRKIIAYYDWLGDAGWDEDGHGTHIACTLAGDNRANLDEYDENDGIAYRAKLVVQDVGEEEGLHGIPYLLGGYFQQAYDAGVRLHSNSWGESWEGDPDRSYNYHSKDVDDFMWKHQDFLIFYANGNDGPSDDTVGAPATAKNCVSVGSCLNPHGAQSQEDMAESSSHGPALDGRTKPTIAAPGQYLMSAESDANISSYNCNTSPMSGTSAACPVAAAAAALVRQYFMDGFYPTGSKTVANGFVPSASLMKAVLINGAADMTGGLTGGAIPGTGQGWGRILLDSVLYFAGDDRKLLVWDIDSGLQTGRSDEYTITTTSSDMLKITLVWTDYPSTSAAQENLVNDLDLVATSPSGAIYRGNVFSYGLSIPGGNHDRLNVEECIYIRSPEMGDWVIRVEGYNAPQGPQPYSLVVTGAEESGGVKPPELSDGSVAPFSGSVSTTFTYSVHYYDPDGSAPTVGYVAVDDTPHALALSSGIASNGDYQYQTKLSSGSHTYYFYFEDSDGQADRLPEEGALQGPTIGGANLAPVLSQGQVWPNSGNLTTTFSFWVHYYDANADAPETIQVIIDGSTTVPMVLYSGMPYDGDYRFQTNQLVLGTHNFYFYCSDGSGGDDRLPTSGTYPGPEVVSGNVTPSLADGQVTPESGTTDTTFIYTVRYSDGDGDAPATGVVYVDEEAHGMSLQSGSANDGVYIFATRLSQGPHTYYFSFEDPDAATARQPASGSYSGPEVGAGNSPPVLTEAGVTPESGGTETPFVYQVHYYDANGDAPVTAMVFIDDYSNVMGLSEGSASNGVYQFSKTLSEGQHRYYFYFYDGGFDGEVRLPPSGASSGPNVYSGTALKVNLVLNGTSFQQGDNHIVWISCSNNGPTTSADLYVVLAMPSGVWLYFPTFSDTPSPLLTFEFVSGFSMAGYQLINQPLPALEHGTYAWYSALTTPGTGDVQSNVATAYWSFTVE